MPKGHLREDESPVDAALREVEEETGWRCVVLSEAGALRYRTEKEGPKEVRFWNMRTVCQVRSEPTPEEVAEVAWVSPKKALCTLTYSDQAHLLAYAFLQAGAIGTESPSAAYAVAFAAGFSGRVRGGIQ